MDKMPAGPPSAGGSNSASDAALAQRLERLAQRRAGAEPGGPAPAGGSSRRTRRHPARQARAAAAGLTLASTAALTAFFALGGPGGTQQVSAAGIVAGTSPTTAGSVGQPSPTVAGPAPAAPTTTAPASNGQPVVVDGGVFQNRWGNVQVEATFGPDGSLVSVDAIQTPNDRGTSIQINDYAVPRLDQEALSVQGAQVHTISGATYTSHDYALSLQSAIDAARAANVTQLS